MRVLHALLVLAGIVALGEVAYTVHVVRPKILVTITNVDRAAIAAGAAAGNLEKASRAWEKSSQDTASNTLKAMSNVSAAAAQLTSSVSVVEKSVSGLLLTSEQVITQQSANLSTSQTALQNSLLEVQKTNQALQKTLVDADAQIANPAIGQSVNNLAEMTKQGAATMTEAAGTVKDVHTAADYELKQLLAPVSKVKAAFLFTVKAVGIFLGF